MADKAADSAPGRPAETASADQRLKLHSSYGQAVMWSKGFGSEETKAEMRHHSAQRFDCDRGPRRERLGQAIFPQRDGNSFNIHLYPMTHAGRPRRNCLSVENGEPTMVS
jgi:hypothetical protein